MLLELQNITLGELLDFGQTSGIFTILGFMFRQFLAFRDMKRDITDLQTAKDKAEQTAKELADKTEEKELQREAVYHQILEEVREVKVDVRLLKESHKHENIPPTTQKSNS